MSQFRKTLTRIGGGAVAVAAATALLAPGVAVAEPDADSGSSALGSVELFAGFLPEDVTAVFERLQQGKINPDEVGECIMEWFGLEELTKNPIEVGIACLLSQHPEDPEIDPNKDTEQKLDNE